MEEVLSKDARIDTKRAGVMGRSYGGYMTLIQAGMHSELWKGAVDMFGPYDLLTFSDRIPETWKPYFKVALGDPSTKDGVKFLTERSPKKYLQNLACPMLVIQGRNDPRVVASESEDLVKNLSAIGKDIAIHVFEDEGHDVLKYNNRVDCYSMITEFFRKNLV
jgi:dipeptidyl aminopeptidase/acylaminoacyl peptidase